MSNNQPKHIIHATGVIKTRIEELRKLVASTPDGEEREAHKKELSELLASIGLDGIGIEITPADNGEGVAAKILGSVNAATEQLGKVAGAPVDEVKKVEVKVEGANGEKVTSTTTVNVEKPGLWTRFKAWCAENKKKVIAGGLALVAGAAGLWYWLNGKNTSVAVSSVADAEVTIDTTTVEPSTPAEADPSIFTRIGEWVVNAAATVKGWTVSAWTWVKGLFTRNTTSETTVDTTAETPVAA